MNFGAKETSKRKALFIQTAFETSSCFRELACLYAQEKSCRVARILYSCLFFSVVGAKLTCFIYLN